MLPKIIAILGAHQQGWSIRRIARTIRLPRSTVQHWCQNAHRRLLPALRAWLPRELALRVPDADIARLVTQWTGDFELLIGLLRSHAARLHPALARGPRCPFRFLLRYLSARGVLTAFDTTQDGPGKGPGPPSKGPPGGGLA